MNSQEYIFKSVDLFKFSKPEGFYDCPDEKYKNIYCKKDVDYFSKIQIIPELESIFFVAPKETDIIDMIYLELKELFGRGADRVTEFMVIWDFPDKRIIAINYMPHSCQVWSVKVK